MRAFSVLLFLWIAGAVWAGDFDEANQLYDQGKFGDAKQRYEQLAGQGEWSANLFYNLGNADYRIGAPGKAMLNYERALALDGTHAEARANLKWLREQAGARLAARRWWEYAYPEMPGDVFAVVGTVAFWGVVFAVAGVISRRRFFGWAAFAFLLAAYAGVGVWRTDQERAVAIVTGKEVSAKLAPADRASLAEPLPWMKISPPSRVRQDGHAPRARAARMRVSSARMMRPESRPRRASSALG